uniref:Cytochrome P450 3638C1 n=1 Tax=Maconellicoccus hirsutus TaxID=177089 RepID=A0AAT9UU68_MACHI
MTIASVNERFLRVMKMPINCNILYRIISKMKFELCYAILLFYILTIKWRMQKKTSMLRSFNRAPSPSIIESVCLLRGNMKDCAAKQLKLLKEYKPPFVIWLFRTPMIVIGDKHDVQTVLKTTQESNTRRFFGGILNNNASISQNEIYHKVCQTIVSAFTPAMMQRYFPLLNQYSERLASKLEPHCDTAEAFNIGNYISSVTLDIITQNMTGYKLSSLENKNTKFFDAFFKLLKMETMRCTFPSPFPPVMFNTYLYLSGNLDKYEEIHRLSRKIVQNRLRELSKRGRDHHYENAYETVEGPETLLDLLLQLKDDKHFTEKHIRVEVLNMIMMGYKSTFLTISSVLLMLAANLDAQEKVYEEIRTILGDDERKVQMEDIKDLVYMEQCINETLRKFPIIPTATRRHNKDIELNDKKIIPAGCQILVNFHSIHHDKRIFPNSDEWDPKHFAPNNISRIQRQIYPYGADPRSEISAEYAMISVKIQLIHLLRRYRLSTSMKKRNIHFVLDLGLRNSSGYWLKLSSRSKNNPKHL